MPHENTAASERPSRPHIPKERLLELRDILHHGWDRDGDTENEMCDAIDELLSLRQLAESGRAK